PKRISDHLGVLCAAELVAIGTAQSAKQNYRTPGLLKRNPYWGGSGQRAHNANDGCRKNWIPKGFVVETHVPARYGHFKKSARLSKAFNGLSDLGHNLGFLRISEIQVIRRGDRKRA